MSLARAHKGDVICAPKFTAGRSRFLDHVTLVALFLQATEAWRLLGYLVGIPSIILSISFAALFSLYCVIRWRIIFAFVNQRLGRIWLIATLIFFVVMLGLQVLDGTVSGSRAVYWMFFSLLFASEMFAAAVLWYRRGPQLTMPFCIWALVITGVGFALNLLDDRFIHNLMAYTSNSLASTELQSRLVGFYGQANMAAFAVTLFVACLIADGRFMRANILLHAFVIGSGITAVVATGSRTSLILLAIVLAWYLVTLLRMSARHKTDALRVFFAPLVLLGSLAIALRLFAIVVGTNSTVGLTIMDRLTSIGGSLGTDASVRARAGVIDVYLDAIWKSPWLGHGPDYAAAQISAGTFTNVSQNFWLEWAARSGVIMVAIFIIAFAVTLIAARRASKTEWAWPRAALIILLFAVASFSIVDILWLRGPAVVLGLTLGIIFRSLPTPSNKIR